MKNSLSLVGQARLPHLPLESVEDIYQKILLADPGAFPHFIFSDILERFSRRLAAKTNDTLANVDVAGTILSTSSALFLFEDCSNRGVAGAPNK